MAGYNYNKPLKILMTADTVGGVWTYTVELCSALKSFNVEVHLVTLGALMQPSQKEDLKPLHHVTVYETSYPLEWMANPWQEIEGSYAYLLALKDKIKPDIIHLNNYVYGLLDWGTPVLMVAHSDVYSWFRSVKGENPGADWEEYYRRVRAGLQSADHVVAPSAFMLQEIFEIYAPSADNTVIYNARAADLFSIKAKKTSVMSMGRIWDEAKNIQLVLGAADYIQGQITIAGDNSFAANSLDIVHQNITYAGKLDTATLSATLSTTAVYVLPALYEPFGLSVLEAALSGCALVLGDIPSLKEIWQDNAVYVATGDARALAAAINELLDDNQKRQGLAQKALQHAQQYSPLRMAKAYMELYGKLKTIIKRNIDTATIA